VRVQKDVGVGVREAVSGYGDASQLALSGVEGVHAVRCMASERRAEDCPPYLNAARHEFETRSFPESLAACPRGFAFYLADPIGSAH
jgi:hypothetical protein